MMCWTHHAVIMKFSSHFRLVYAYQCLILNTDVLEKRESEERKFLSIHPRLISKNDDLKPYNSDMGVMRSLI